MDLIDIGIEKGLIAFSNDRKQITYIHQNKKRNYSNPEEQVQAETFLKLILIYGYPVERIQQFVPVTMGSTTKEADILVYADNDKKEPLIIVECKKPEVSELEFEQAVKQGFAYCFATAKTIKYLWVTSGIKDVYYQVNKEQHDENSIPDIPRFGQKTISKYKYAKGGVSGNFTNEPEAGYGNKLEAEEKFFDLEVVSEEELTRRFRLAHQSLWAGGELNPSEAFDELDKLIFCKIWDERHPRRTGEPYQFQIFYIPVPPKASKKKKDEIEQRITNELYDRVVALYAEGKERDPEVFKDNIRLNAAKVRTVVTYLEGINLSKTDLDSKGRAFEAFMGSYFRGDFGQFFTPRNIVKFIVDVLPIENTSRVLDTSCGSGGFLLYALDKIRAKASEYYDETSVEHYKYWHDFAEKNLFGIEINEQIARTAKMNMIIHDDGHTNVIASDGLLPSEDMIKKSGNKEFKYGSFDYIITNPPFGSTVRQTERAYMHQYNMAIKDADWLDVKKQKAKNRANQSTEVMFIEQCYKFLKPGGYLAIVIPDGILTNSSLQYVRDQIEDWYRIVAVVSMPQDAFAHTGAAVKSSVMFLRKLSSKRSDAIKAKKVSVQDKILKDRKFEKQIADWEKEKKKILKDHIGFESHSGKTKATNLGKKEIEATQEFKDWKSEINAEYNQKINDLKDQLADLYLEEKQKALEDYPIFMAIAEKIGYDATGKTINENELESIVPELRNFIDVVNKQDA
ncbi:restriction endonuclease subunit M [Marinoscillum furvescens]|uniref:Type I restriction enzyme M protein n=1 Tax=Marinoscillum furvescens DSM 4134 TaxID=1122208 RepID=A0A3D9KW79_MARFU|nr:N-6 DNA methylase [Marinoscillum furvescens]RED92194.1 type I restriction enzyme M protein [Marinoscillum furvescens DSM 4134]